MVVVLNFSEQRGDTRCRHNKEKGELDKAISDYNEAIKINPKYAGPYYNKAQALEKLGRKKEALDAYKNVINYASSKDERFISIAKQRIKELEK